MTAKDLIELLQDLDPQTEVRLAIQPNYPFEHSIDGLAISREHGQEVAHIYEGGQIGYLPGKASAACGWSEDDDDREYDYDTRDEE